MFPQRSSGSTGGFRRSGPPRRAPFGAARPGAPAGRPVFRRKPFSGGGRSRPGGFGGGRTGGGRGGGSGNRFGKYIDPALFVNKAVITEEITEFKPEHAFVDFTIEPELNAFIFNI